MKKKFFLPIMMLQCASCGRFAGLGDTSCGSCGGRLKSPFQFVSK